MWAAITTHLQWCETTIRPAWWHGTAIMHPATSTQHPPKARPYSNCAHPPWLQISPRQLPAAVGEGIAANYTPSLLNPNALRSCPTFEMCWPQTSRRLTLAFTLPWLKIRSFLVLSVLTIQGFSCLEPMPKAWAERRICILSWCSWSPRDPSTPRLPKHETHYTRLLVASFRLFQADGPSRHDRRRAPSCAPPTSHKTIIGKYRQKNEMGCPQCHSSDLINTCGEYDLQRTRFWQPLSNLVPPLHQHGNAAIPARCLDSGWSQASRRLWVSANRGGTSHRVWGKREVGQAQLLREALGK